MTDLTIVRATFASIPKVACFLLLGATLLIGVPVSASLRAEKPRQIISLDGTWQIEQGAMDAVPKEFTHKVVVPGLVDLAKPAFAEVGTTSTLRQAFWYRRTFKVKGEIPAVAILKIHKARYGTKVWVNGQLVGEHLPCFTPAYFDVKPHLKGGGAENELIIRVGAHRTSLPQDMPTGWDFEKYLYIPGIYDSVELILTGTPYIRNVQIAPDIETGTARVVAEIVGAGSTGEAVVEAAVREVRSGKRAGEVKSAAAIGPEGETKLDMKIPVQNCRLWSPEDPFLYELTIKTPGDAARVRFGMRSFRFDPETRRAILNGKPYYLRGSNVTCYRFFEDAERGTLPWNKDWVERLHRKFKTMHWNSLRYCIGFPPEFWYDIADETGILIQDEFPIWLLGKAPENPVAEKIIPEYTEWMRERWNHPCVVIWDAQNESHTEETGKAIRAVRALDLSNRPWDNGWAAPQSPTDCVEAHPYLCSRMWQGKGVWKLKDMPSVSPVPRLQAAQRATSPPIIINEYGWLWLTRDGNPTCLTTNVYQTLLGPNSTVEQRRVLYARYLAAKTEFWRAHRECAGVLHFCGLGYSRPGDKPRPEGGATSDHWIDLRRLKFEPNFEKYVRDAFNPVGLMLDFWAEEVAPGAQQDVKVYVINDLYQDWSGDVIVWILRSDKRISMQSKPCTVAALGRQILTLKIAFPDLPGDYVMVAELRDPKGKTVRSLRDFKIAK
ncbi:MAG: hypothetical protein N3D11_05435 [Candidatus Sumerlaeia bacterium]|nr:hypothetical protein [Candidatus Sumerlaeia bacterium]